MPLPLLAQVAIQVGLYVLSYALRPRRPDAEKGKLTAPTAEEGGPIPVIFGTVLVTPNTVWAGDIRQKAVEESDGGLFGTGILDRESVIGYRYKAGMQLALCHGPVDEILDIVIGDRSLIHTPPPGFTTAILGTVSSGTPTITPALPLARTTTPTPVPFDVQAPLLFGGKKQEGGVEGTFRLYWGDNTQGKNAYLVSQLGDAETSAYRGLCYLVLERPTLGMTPYLKPIQVVLRRTPCNLSAATACIEGDANAAEVIYEAMIDTRWGCGIPTAHIDTAAFTAAAATLHAEGMGIFGEWRQQASAESLIEDILRHIDALVYEHPVTGLYTLRLIRNDYVLADLPRFNVSNATLEDFSRSSWPETINDVKVRFSRRYLITKTVDGAEKTRATFGTGVAPAQNLAAIQAMGRALSQPHDFPLFSRPENAARAAARVLRAVSHPLAKASVMANRGAHALCPGDPVVLEFPGDNIEELVVRIGRIGYGSLTDGRIPFEAVEDVFDVSGVAYAALDPGQAGGGGGGALPAVYQRAIEIPYFHVGAERHAAAMIARPDGRHIRWRLWRDEGAGYAYRETSEQFVPVGLLEDALGEVGHGSLAMGPIVFGGADLEDLAGTDVAGLYRGDLLMMIGEEILGWRTVTSLGGGRYQLGDVLRGQLDTVPLSHAAGTPVWFYRPVGVLAATAAAMGADATLSLKATPETEGAAVALADAVAMAITTTSRALRPYPPGNVRLGGLGYSAWPDAVAGDAVLTWSHRSRTGQTELVAQDVAGAFAIEGTLTVEVLIGGVVIPARTLAGTTGTTYTYTWAQRQVDDADLAKAVQFRITPIAGALEGTVRTTPAFLMGAP